MTEEQIERIVETRTDRLDKAFTAAMSQEEYDRRSKEIDAWAEAEYAKLKRR